MGTIEKKIFLKILFVLVFVWLNLDCLGQSKIDSAKQITVIKLDTLNNFTLKGYSNLNISESTLGKVIETLQNSIDDYNNSKVSDRQGKIDFSSYRYQIIVGMKDSLQYAYVNAICLESNINIDSWKEYLIVVKDGGKCYFHSVIDINKLVTRSFYVNGR